MPRPCTGKEATAKENQAVTNTDVNRRVAFVTTVEWSHLPKHLSIKPTNYTLLFAPWRMNSKFPTNAYNYSSTNLCLPIISHRPLSKVCMSVALQPHPPYNFKYHQVSSNHTKHLPTSNKVTTTLMNRKPLVIR